MLIGEVSARTGLSRRMLRHYDELGLVSPSARSSSGYRVYSREDLSRLLHVESLRSLGMSLADAARSPDPQIRSRVVRALAALKSAGSTEALRELLDDPDPGIRAGSALELGRRGLHEVAGPLVALVVEGRNDVEAAEILGELASRESGAPDIAASLIARLRDPGCPAEARCRLTQALAEIPGADVDETLRDLAGDPELQVSMTAKAVLAMRGE